MTKKGDTYEEWLETIKSTRPTLDKPEELTNEILNRIKTLPAGTSHRKEETGKTKTSRILIFVSKTSGIAAVLLLCFLLRETVFFPQGGQITEQSNTSNAVRQEKASSLPGNWNTECSLLEKSRYLSRQWKEYKKGLSEKKASFLSKRISVETITHSYE